MSIIKIHFKDLAYKQKMLAKHFVSGRDVIIIADTTDKADALSKMLPAAGNVRRFSLANWAGPGATVQSVAALMSMILPYNPYRIFDDVAPPMQGCIPQSVQNSIYLIKGKRNRCVTLKGPKVCLYSVEIGQVYLYLWSWGHEVPKRCAVQLRGPGAPYLT